MVKRRRRKPRYAVCVVYGDECCPKPHGWLRLVAAAGPTEAAMACRRYVKKRLPGCEVSEVLTIMVKG